MTSEPGSETKAVPRTDKQTDRQSYFYNMIVVVGVGVGGVVVVAVAVVVVDIVVVVVVVVAVVVVVVILVLVLVVVVVVNAVLYFFVRQELYICILHLGIQITFEHLSQATPS